MRQKHTPGPWVFEVRDSGTFRIRMGTAVESPGHHEAQHSIEWDTSLYPEDGDQYEEAVANGVLAAAAPDLLEACEQALQFIINGRQQGWLSIPDDIDQLARVPAVLRSAIVKATRQT